MHSFDAGLVTGGGLVFLFVIVTLWIDGLRAVKEVETDLKRQGYVQIDLEGMKIKMNFGGSRGNLTYTTPTFSLRVGVARVPRPYTAGKEWRLFLLNDAGGRAPLSQAEFAKMVLHAQWGVPEGYPGPVHAGIG